MFERLGHLLQQGIVRAVGRDRGGLGGQHEKAAQGEGRLGLLNLLQVFSRTHHGPIRHRLQKWLRGAHRHVVTLLEPDVRSKSPAHKHKRGQTGEVLRIARIPSDGHPVKVGHNPHRLP